jgi:glycosyltransferase involved in cell wall biosynthesis
VCFTGAISEERGAFQIVEALRCGSIKLQLAGSYSPRSLRDVLVRLPGWENVIELGQVKRSRLAAIFGSSLAGLVLFHPVPNNVNAQPNKLFEYMSAGLPVIASDFTLWRQIVEGVGCGLCVDPLDPTGVARAMAWLAEHPDEARAMGQRGKAAVRERFNWESEARKLKEIYMELAGR